jgi:5'-3' exonuclease
MNHFDETYMKNLLKFRSMYNIPFENMIIVRDCPRETIWRMNLFPEYKGNRKNTCAYKNKRYNIGNIFKHIYNELYPKLIEQYGFKLIKVENAEADDVIAVLATQIRKIDKNRLVVIISNDNDYLQLVNEKTLIWSLQNRLLNTKVDMTADEILLKKILKGDDSDNIPSIVGSMSETNIIELIKDSSKLEKWLMEHSKKDVFENNQRLIDFSFIPDNIKQNILNQCLDIIPEIKESVEDMKKVDEKPKGVLVDFPTEFWKNMDKIKVKTKTGIFVFNNYYRTNYRRNYLNYKNYGFRRYTNFNYASEQYYFQ